MATDRWNVDATIFLAASNESSNQPRNESVSGHSYFKRDTAGHQEGIQTRGEMLQASAGEKPTGSLEG